MVGKYDLHHNLDDDYHATEQHLELDFTVITHGVDNIIKGVRFMTRDLDDLTTGPNTLIFVANTDETSEKLHYKYRLFNKALIENV